MDLQIYKLNKQHAEKYAEKFISFSEDQAWETWTSENLLRDVPKKWEWSLCASISGLPVGYMIVSEKEDSIHIHHIAIKKDYRRHGIGYLLIRRLEHEILSLQSKLPLTLKVFSKNEEAKTFYRGMFFKEVLETENLEYISFRKENDQIKGIKYAVHQPNFIPWLGYFSKMKAADVFIFLDDVQMPVGRSYVSRTMIRNLPDKEPNTQWLTVPVHKKFEAKINEIRMMEEESWKKSHLSKISQIYRNSPNYNDVMPLLSHIYEQGFIFLKDFNIAFIESIGRAIGLKTKTLLSSRFNIETKSDQRIIDLGKLIYASEYISGEGGENYQLMENFERNNLLLRVSSYPPQKYEEKGFPFCYGLSILDCLFVHGISATKELLTLNYK
ncbi:WbqC family protein [Kamptonema cortianum]|nr:WbqC family protein [Geitlerinema splendidum]MDK3159547.1 WbqC family protein [Kamptonema cortianum]